MLTPTDKIILSGDAELRPGIYYLPNGIQVVSDGVSVDGNGAILVGKAPRCRRIGIEIIGAVDTTIRQNKFALNPDKDI